MSAHTDYERRVCEAAREIVFGEYEAYDRHPLSPQTQRFSGMRPFWSGMTFSDVSLEGAHPDTELVLRFKEDNTGRQCGFREGIWKVVQWWDDYGPPADLRNDPERLAHEMLFIMVYAVADTPGEVFTEPTPETTWFTGGEAWTAVVRSTGERIPILR